MLVRLLYVSHPVKDSSCETLSNIMVQSHTHNPKNGITGILCHSENMYMQVLEGGRDAVNILYAKIIRDPRHTHITLLHYDEIDERRYVSWIMGKANLAKLNTALLLRYSDLPELNPDTITRSHALALIDDLVAAATIIKHS